MFDFLQILSTHCKASTVYLSSASEVIILSDLTFQETLDVTDGIGDEREHNRVEKALQVKILPFSEESPNRWVHPLSGSHSSPVP